jgi:hypothetical protein
MNKQSIWSVALCAGFALGACGTKDEGPMNQPTGADDDVDDDDDDDDSTGATPVTTGIDPDTAGPMTSAATDTGGTTVADSGSAGDDVVFLLEPDGGGVEFECDLFAQDCPEGEKCMPWSNDGSTWNATRCSPIDGNPGQPGDECTVEGSGTSGIDSCDLGSMCWDVDPKTNMGLCVAMCTGDEANPICDDPDTTCSIANDGAIVLCLLACDPIVQDCPEGNACYPVAEDWVCGPDASGEMGGYGDPCEFINVCDAGLMCLDASATPGCEGAVGCCTEVCDTTDPAGDAQCTGAAEGQVCTPWYEEGAAPPGYEDVGACALPA